MKTVAAVSMAPGAVLTAPGAPDRRMLYGACVQTADEVGRMKTAGFDFCEMAVSTALDPSKDDAWWTRRRDELRALPLPLRSCNGFIPRKFRLTGPKADPEPALRYGETALRRAEEVGIRTIVFGSGGARNVPGDFTSGVRPDVERGTEQYADFCRELCRRCADLKHVQVAIEPLRPNETNIINYVWQGLRICETVDSPRLVLLADLFHMMTGGEDASSLVRAKKWLKHCHVADYGTRKFPGFDPKETQRLRPYFNALASIGYEGGVSCECGWTSDFDKDCRTALRTMKGLSS